MTMSTKEMLDYFANKETASLWAGVDGVYAGNNLASVFSIDPAKPNDIFNVLYKATDNGEYNNIHVGDYFPIKLTNNNTINMIVMGIDTYYNTGEEPIPHHIDLISKEQLAGRSFNVGAYNAGNNSSNYPWSLMSLKAYLNSEVADVAYSASETRHVDYRADGFSNLLPDIAKLTTIPKYVYSGNRGTNITNDNSYTWHNLGKVWIPSEVEVFGSCILGTPIYNSLGQVQYPLFKAFTNRCAEYSWWTYTPRASGTNMIVSVANDGHLTSNTATSLLHPRICLRIGHNIVPPPTMLSDTPTTYMEE